MNVVNIMGRLTQTPELKETSSGTAICNFSVALNRGDNTTFVPVTAFGKNAELVSKFLSKGDRVAVEGTLYSSKREIDGKSISQLSVTANFVHFVEPPTQRPSEPAPVPEKPKPDPVIDEDLPF
jgi:single-strand DNA-binding protein